MFENRDCAHCLFGVVYDSSSPYGQMHDHRTFVQCVKSGRTMNETDSAHISCWKFARRKNFPSNDEQIRNLRRNRLGRRIENMSFISLVALVFSLISLAVSLNLPQLIKQWLGIG
jgi:hypothetical protein